MSEYQMHISGTGGYNFWGFIFELLMPLEHSKKKLLKSAFILASLK